MHRNNALRGLVGEVHGVTHVDFPYVVGTRVHCAQMVSGNVLVLSDEVGMALREPGVESLVVDEEVCFVKAALIPSSNQSDQISLVLGCGRPGGVVMTSLRLTKMKP